MSSRKVLALSVTIAALVGGGVGYFVGIGVERIGGLRSFTNDVTITYYDSASRTLRDVEYLSALRQGDNAAAIAKLEAALDGELEWISTYHAYMPAKGRCAHVYDALDAARNYRSKYASPETRSEKLAAIQLALSMRRDTAPSGLCRSPSSN